MKPGPHSPYPLPVNTALLDVYTFCALFNLFWHLHSRERDSMLFLRQDSYVPLVPSPVIDIYM